jgi:hypothetical protein
LCGRHLQSRDRTVTCPHCGREIHIEWPAPEMDIRAGSEKVDETKTVAVSHDS